MPINIVPIKIDPLMPIPPPAPNISSRNWTHRTGQLAYAQAMAKYRRNLANYERKKLEKWREETSVINQFAEGFDKLNFSGKTRKSRKNRKTRKSRR